MCIDKLTCTISPYRTEDQHDSSAMPAPTSPAAPRIAPTHIQVDGEVVNETQPMDYQTWLSHVAPKPWRTGQTYVPGDQVNHGGNVYQLAGSSSGQDTRPGTEGSNWWYSGSLQNNYNYYAKLQPESPSYVEPNRPPPLVHPVPVPPVDGQPGTKSGEFKVLKNFSDVFPEHFEEIGNFLTKKIDPFWGTTDKPRSEGLTIYGGLNSEGDRYYDYLFESFEKIGSNASLPTDTNLQFFYLRPEDKGKSGNVDPSKYKMLFNVIDYSRSHMHDGINHVQVVSLPASFIVPKEWGQLETELFPPDYGYLYLPSYDRTFSQMAASGDSTSIAITNKYNDYAIPTRYEGP